MNGITRHWRLGVLVVLAGCAAGCGVVDTVLGGDRPRASVAGVGFEGITAEALTLRFDIDVDNPYPVALPLVDLDYALASAGQQFLSGQAPVQGSVPAGGTRRISVPAAVRFTDLLAVAQGVRLGAVVPYEATLGLSVDAPQIGALRLPLATRGELPVPAPPQVSVEQVRWDSLTLDRATGTVRLNIVNPNSFAASLTTLNYALSLAGVRVADTSLARSAHFAADGGSAAVELPLSFSPISFGLAALRALQGAGASYTLEGTTGFETPFGPMTLPLGASGQTRMVAP